MPPKRGAGSLASAHTSNPVCGDNRGCYISVWTRPMATRRPATVVTTEPAQQKLRQTQAEYSAARPVGEPHAKSMMSSSKMYVCRRCHANFKTGDGKPDPRVPGLGKCNACLALVAAAA